MPIGLPPVFSRSQATFSASCHICHVLPVKEYMSFSLGKAGGPAPAWIQGMDNPVIANQSCMECHLARGRGTTDCAGCHSDGSATIEITERCEACHDDRVMVSPFQGMHCRNCHVEAFQDQDDRVHAVMQTRFGGPKAHATTSEGTP